MELPNKNILDSIKYSMKLNKSDAVLASYPKSGRNWVLFLIANAFLHNAGCSFKVTFQNVHSLVPEDCAPGFRKPWGPSYPNVVATHKKISAIRPQLLYLIRHPADVMVSYYHFLRYRRGKKLDDFSDFIRDSRFGLPAWTRHVEYYERKSDHTVRYEDLLENTSAMLSAMCGRIGVELSEDDIAYAVRESSFEKMKCAEEQYGLPGESASPDFRFMRKGQYSEGVEEFSQSDYRFLKQTAGHLLEVHSYGGFKSGNHHDAT